MIDTSHNRACWLLQFCERDLTQLTDQALGQLQGEWVEFQRGRWKWDRPPAQSRLTQWQQAVIAKLDELKNGQSWSLDCGLWRQLALANGEVHVERNTYARAHDDKHLVRVVDTLEAVSNDLRVCAREKCGRLFVRTKRQAYCSARCRGTEGTQRYRKKKSKLP